MSSLIKYARAAGNNPGQTTHWGRAEHDGLPFRGAAPMFRDDEFDDRVVRVADFRFGFFDVKEQTQANEYGQVMDRCANGWFELKHIERFRNGTTEHYVEWVEYYLEDGSTRTPAVQGALTYGGNGLPGPGGGPG